MNVAACNICGHAFAKFCSRLLEFAISDIANGHLVAGRQKANRIPEFARVADLLVIHFDDDVCNPQPGLLGRRVRNDFRNQCAGVHWRIECFRRGGIDRARGYTEEAATDCPEVQDLVHDRAGNFRGHGKANADVASGPADNRRVNSDKFALHVDKGAARISRVDRRICLDEIFESGADTGPSQCADNAGCDGVAKAEGIPDCNDKVTYAQFFRVAYRHFSQAFGVNPE